MIEYDPCGKFSKIPNADLLNAGGFLPRWCKEYEHYDFSMKKALISNYSFYYGPMPGGKVSEDGTYLFPGDPPLYPYLKITFPNCDETCYIYNYGIVGTVNKRTGEAWLTRMD